MYKDLFASQNLDWCEKYVLTQVRYGDKCMRERGTRYTYIPKRSAEWCGYAFSEEQLKYTYDKLVAVGIITVEEYEVCIDGKEPFDSISSVVNEEKLKKIL